MNDSEYTKANIIVLLLSILLPTILLYGTIDDFIFQHIGLIHKYDIQGYITETDPYFGNLSSGVLGFYAFGITITKICNISYDILPFLPIQLISFVFMLLAVFKNFCNNKILCSLFILIITTFTTNVSFLNFHPHGMGFILFFIVVLSIIILYRSNRSGNADTHNPSFIIILLSLTSINYISYKAMAWTIPFLITLIFIEYTKNFIMRTNQKIIKTFVNIFLLALIIIFYFNIFFYNQFLPQFRNLDSFGIEKILLLFYKDASDPLSNYNLYHVMQELNIMFVREVLIVFFTLLCLIEMLKFVNKDKIFDFKNKIFLSLLCSGLLNLFIYNLFGLFDLKFLTYMSLLSFLILHKKYRKKRLVYIFTIILIAMNVFYLVTAYINNNMQRDDNYFIYIRPSVNWYILHGRELKIKTDVLTKGYYIKEIANKNVEYPTHFSQDDILFTIQKPFDVIPEENIIYVVNYKVEHFSITGWRILKSLKYFKNEIESNHHLNKLYTSSDNHIVIYSVSE